MKLSGGMSILLALVALEYPIKATAADLFNYDHTSGTDYGPADWDDVSCNNLETCPGYPAKLLGSVGWKPTQNQCEWCPLEGNSCGQHRQSPIDLHRDRAIADHENWKECPDWHWMQFMDGTCEWEDMADQFEIGRHALMIHTPLNNNNDIDCVSLDGQRKFPKLDYSKGFPDWWYLSRTEITVPSEHVQHGQRYAAEVKLSHFYEIDHYKNKLGIVSIFMQDFEGEPSWPYLDKLICQWRRAEEEKRKDCGLDPAPAYKMCELYRGQDPDDNDYGGEPTPVLSYPTRAPIMPPPELPIQNFGGNPDDSRFPLQLCQGDCDFSTDCAPGLICQRRDAYEAVDGCVGGEVDETNTDYCVFDPYGEGYTMPTEPPTPAPSFTARPTLVPLPAMPLKDFGGTPPDDKFPLGLCEGDCDRDDHCQTGLICFQRTSNETVPGCIGGETDIQKTDYCVLDPYGPGYVIPPSPSPSAAPTESATSPTAVPTAAPTKTHSSMPSPVASSSPTTFPRPVGEPLRVKNIGWEPPLPLGECEGDCDEDSDCGPGLLCFQRNAAFSPVPGCLGGDEDGTLTDYCHYRILPTSQPTTSPTVAATSGPTGVPTSSPSGSPTESPSAGTPEPSVTSSNAPSKDAVPDLSFVPTSISTDQPSMSSSAPSGVPSGQPTQNPTEGPTAETPEPSEKASEQPSMVSSEPTQAPTQSPTAATPAPSPSPTTSPTAAPVTPAPTNRPLTFIAWTPPQESRPLGVCEGDCDIDNDCGEGLVCFQRYRAHTHVPGCSGGEEDSSLADFCVPESALETAGPTSSPSEGTPSPTMAPSDATEEPSMAPSGSTEEPSMAPSTDAPPPINCDDYSEVNFFRMCKANSCCSNPRSSSEFCLESYVQLGDAVESACHHCCIEEHGDPREVGPAAVPNPDVPQTLSCDQVEDSKRMCKANSCCEESGSHTDWCEAKYALFPNDIESICWYCCFPSKEINFDLSRKLAATEETEDSQIPNEGKPSESSRPPSDRDRETHDVSGRKVIVREENFEPKGMLDEDAYFEEIHRAFRRRMEDTSETENYEHVAWWPYEWLLKVGTEYYFRYEGTQTVPPCYDTAHWRVMKDPIRVAPHQMRELERLIASRLGDNCEVDTAGKPRDDGSGAVDVNRPLQSFHTLHRKVFCECQDWPSKFPEDRTWCLRWQTNPPEDRLFNNPYNWPSDGFDFLN